MKNTLKILLGRVGIIGLLIFIQLAILVLFMINFQNYFVYFYAICGLLSLLCVFFILNNNSNPGYKIAWIIPILLFPIFGGIFYLLFGSKFTHDKISKKFSPITDELKLYLTQDTNISNEILNQNNSASNQSKYINDYAYCPIYKNTSTEYLNLGERKFERLLTELRNAKHYIFLEYFIIQEGTMWDTILKILKEKAANGVDVRVIYDDFGCLFLLPSGYAKKLESMGIKCCVFNPFVPSLSIRMNNRDHRKIVIIDGHTAFNGGINLADEYINAIEVHGHWKDTSVILKGDAVWSFTVMFLTMWQNLRKTKENFEQYRPHLYHDDHFNNDGYVQPYTDNPMSNEEVGESVYLNLINQANNYIHITTPYLIIDNETRTALSLAAKRGVDVCIITPHLGDKWYVHGMTRSNYNSLIEAGVKIYEYTPGFIHAKTIVVDDEYAVVGTINFDYRSLYLQFECATFLYKTSSVLDVRDDFIETLKVCEPVTTSLWNSIPIYKRAIYSIVTIFAPLM